MSLITELKWPKLISNHIVFLKSRRNSFPLQPVYDFTFEIPSPTSKFVHRMVTSPMYNAFKVDDVTVLSSTEAKSTISNVADNNIHLEGGYVVVNFEPYGLHESDLDYILKNSTLFYSKGGVCGDSDAISFGTFMKCTKGSRYTIDLYGKDKHTLTAHIVRHILHLENYITSGQLTLYIRPPENFNTESIKQLLKETFDVDNSIIVHNFELLFVTMPIKTVPRLTHKL